MLRVMGFRLRSPTCQELGKGGLHMGPPGLSPEQRLWSVTHTDRRCTWFGLPGGLLLLVDKRNVKSVVNDITNQEVSCENPDTQLVLNRKPWPQ